MSYRLMLLGMLAALFIGAGCKPTYPKCDNNDHCKEGEYCVNGQCQQCRNNSDCDPGKQCNEGRCDPIAGWCKTNDDCPGGQACKDNKCGPCASNAECGPDGRCVQGKCLKPGECVTDDDCPENNECQNGRCVAPPSAAIKGTCDMPTIYFDFNEHVLTSEATSKLQAVADCAKKEASRKVRVEGHCDPRGTDEYNLALGDRRARSVVKYLKRLGLGKGRLRPVSKGKIEATGTNESGWARDRKVQFAFE